MEFAVSLRKTMKSYDTSTNGRETMKECFAFIFSFSPLTFWHMGQESRNSRKAALTLVASPLSLAHLDPQRRINFL